MGLRVKSLSEDSVDAYTHTWTVFFFLFLAFILLVVPNVPGKQNVAEQQNEMKSQTLEKLKIDCWCPAHFEESQKEYTNRVCAEKYVSPKERKMNASDIRLFHDPRFHGSSSEHKNVDSSSNENERSNTKPDDDKNEKENLFRLQGPLVLFIFAIALRVPWLFWSILSRYFSSVDIGRTLESAEKGDAMVSSDRQQIYNDLIQAFTKCTRANQKTVTYLYILMKVLMILVISSEIIFIYANILPKLEIQEPSRAESSKPTEAETTPNPPTTVLNLSTEFGLNSSTTPGTVVDQMKELRRYQDSLGIFYCFFTIRQMTNIHTYNVQCIIEKRPEQPLPTPPSQSPLLLNVFLIPLGALVILLVINALNTLVWLIGLASDYTRYRMGVSEDSPLDLVFLVLMARTNLGVGVASGLAECSRGRKSTKEDGEGLLLQKLV